MENDQSEVPVTDGIYCGLGCPHLRKVSRPIGCHPVCSISKRRFGLVYLKYDMNDRDLIYRSDRCMGWNGRNDV